MKLVFLIVLLLISLINYSQNDSCYKYYVGVNGGKGMTSDFHTDLSIVTKSDYVYNIFYLSQNKKSPSLPPDFIYGGLKIFGDGIPRINICTFGFSCGKLINTKYNSIKINLRGGFLIGEIFKPYNFVPRQSQSSGMGFNFNLNSNYTYDIKKEYIYGLFLNPGIEFMFSRFLGIRAGICANINLIESTVGGELGIIFGRLKTNKIENNKE